MPIRMTDDPAESDDSGGGFEGGDGGRGGGGGGGLFGLLPLIFGLIRGPKSLLLIMALAVAGYFFLGRGGGCNTAGIVQDAQQLATGGILDPRQFDKSKVYESLSDDDNKNPLPESANLQKYAPAVGDQGKQGSCVAWSSAYGARTILESVRTGDGSEFTEIQSRFFIQPDRPGRMRGFLYQPRHGFHEPAGFGSLRIISLY